MKSWQGKVVLITGGSSGLGLALARAFANRQAYLVLAARDAGRLEQAASALSQGDVEVLTVPTDITRQAEVDRLIEAILVRFGRLDVLVNCAGCSARGDALTTTVGEFSQLMDLNFLALVRCTQAAMPQIAQHRGHVLNIGSLAGKIGARYMGAYSATKFAVAGYSQQLRLELAPRGVHVLLVSPGPIARDEPRSYAHDANKSLPADAMKPGGGAKVSLLSPDWLAERIVLACESRQPELVVPGRARLLFAVNQLWPTLGDWLIRKLT